jgi:hypothetical protein
MSLPAFRQEPPELIIPADSFSSGSTGAVSPPSRALYIGASGTIGFTDRAGTSTYAIPVTAGLILPVQITQLSSIGGGASVYIMR